MDMKYLMRLGKAMMLPVACLPVAGLMMGAGYWLQVLFPGHLQFPVQLLILAGSSLLSNMSLLFAVGVAVGLSDEQKGISALASVVSYLMIQYLLSPETVPIISGGRIAPEAFEHIDNQFIGICCGILGAYCYNTYRNQKLPGPFGIFSGRRFVSIAAVGYAAAASAILLFLWPSFYEICVYFGTSFLDTGALGVGAYMFLNRLLIPTGLHHALNSVFWFDLAGISDLKNFFQGTGVYGQTGQYMTGFYPVMMFGLPGAGLAMYQTAKPEKRKMAGGLIFSAVLCSMMTGVTELMEFAFMFLAPGLFFLHAFLTGLSGMICALLPFRVGFNFSAGLMDYMMAIHAPMAQNPWLLWPVGIAFGILYYVLFRFCILHFNLKTPGREEDEEG